MNTLTAQAPGAGVFFAPTLAGDIVVWPMQGQTLYLQSGGYLASAATVDTGHTGPGRIYLQTRSQGAFLDWLIPRVPKTTGS